MWIPFFDSGLNRLENVQKQFLLFALRDLGWSNRFSLPPYKERLLLLNMLPLSKRQELACLIFIHDVLNHRIRSEELSSQFIFRDSVYSLRYQTLLLVRNPRSRYVSNELMNRCSRLFNSYCSSSDLVFSREAFKRAITIMLRLKLG